MSLISSTIAAAERAPLPDVLIRAGISALRWRTATRLADAGEQSDTAFAKAMAERAIAEETDAANTQHYEVPAAFFAKVLGPHRKYSSGFYIDDTTTLRRARIHTRSHNTSLAYTHNPCASRHCAKQCR